MRCIALLTIMLAVPAYAFIDPVKVESEKTMFLLDDNYFGQHLKLPLFAGGVFTVRWACSNAVSVG